MTRAFERRDVAVLGATGMVGQQFVRLLSDHPWFRLTSLGGSARTAGRAYGEAVDWCVGGRVPESAASLRLLEPGADAAAPIIFSALPGEAARTLEIEYRDRGHAVFTNAGPHRFGEGRVPVISEVNGNRLEGLCRGHRSARGCIVPNSNCVVAGLAPPLAAVDDEFGLTSVTVTTLQALSGAGLSGVSALEALGNVIPEIPGEADKIIRETLAVLDIEIPMSVDVHRVPVHTGHLASVRARTRTRPDPGDVAEVMASFRGRPPLPSLPTAPAALIRVHASRSRPQPILDVDAGGGMVLSVGGIGRDDLYDVKFEVLIHNTIRGAAGASVLNAELAVTRGILGVWGLDSEPLEPGCVIGR